MAKSIGDVDLTGDRCLVLASDTLDDQAGYTAFSPGRTDNRIYLITQPEPEPAPAPSERRTISCQASRRDSTIRDAMTAWRG